MVAQLFTMWHLLNWFRFPKPQFLLLRNSNNNICPTSFIRPVYQVGRYGRLFIMVSLIDLPIPVPSLRCHFEAPLIKGQICPHPLNVDSPWDVLWQSDTVLSCRVSRPRLAYTGGWETMGSRKARPGWGHPRPPSPQPTQMQKRARSKPELPSWAQPQITNVQN